MFNSYHLLFKNKHLVHYSLKVTQTDSVTFDKIALSLEALRENYFSFSDFFL